ncbi:MAG: citramalate synthase [Elusimicrobia bacterium]|nr:citramalate synthase [Elusimicrobiota bacterium]
MSPVRLFDTTLRDGTQGAGVSLSVEDKLKVMAALDRLGVHYIEGGWPGSNPKDEVFFHEAKHYPFKCARLTAFGSTRRKDVPAHRDENLLAIVKVKTPVACIFGKSWDLHVIHALRTSLDENLRMIGDSVRFLKSKGLEVVYDAEHFFDGFRADPQYALSALRSAWDAGADNLTLCDTNGGSIPSQIAAIVKEVRKFIPQAPLGIHAHNDSECAVANSVTAVQEGCSLVQGTMNGYGERCGNANLISIAANLRLKLGYDVLSEKQLQSLTEVSRYVSEVANIVPNDHQPYVGYSAFAHKGGVHVSAMARHMKTYEHIDPSWVGNTRRILISELSGQSNILLKARELDLDFSRNSRALKQVIEIVKKMEHQGHQFEGAEASFAMLVLKTLGLHRPSFDLKGFRVSDEKDLAHGKVVSEATLKLKVKGVEQYTVAEGDGPVNALDNALRRALEHFYPSLRSVALTDFKVRVINAAAGTKARVRVFIQSRDEKDEWGCIGVSENIIDASWIALVDSIEYKLWKDNKNKKKK